MNTSAPDMIILDQGRPVVVVEAKARPVSPVFWEAVIVQMHRYAVQAASQWAVLADPRVVRIYKGVEFSVPIVEIPTRDVLNAVGLSDVKAVGEGIILLAMERWLGDGATKIVTLSPLLGDFAQAVEQSDEVRREFRVA